MPRRGVDDPPFTMLFPAAIAPEAAHEFARQFLGEIPLRSVVVWSRHRDAEDRYDPRHRVPVPAHPQS